MTRTMSYPVVPVALVIILAALALMLLPRPTIAFPDVVLPHQQVLKFDPAGGNYTHTVGNYSISVSYAAGDGGCHQNAEFKGPSAVHETFSQWKGGDCTPQEPREAFEKLVEKIMRRYDPLTQSLTLKEIVFPLISAIRGIAAAAGW